MYDRLLWFAMIGLVLTGAGTAAAAPAPDIFSYPTAAAARQHWQPQFGSPPVQVQKLPDGTTCLVLAGDFKRPGDRLCWDWVGHLDLSATGAVAFEQEADTPALAGTIGVYFGTAGGWYGTFHMRQPSNNWSHVTLALDNFSEEGKPQGWDQVTRFRFSVWSNAAGHAVYRLRAFHTIPRDPHRNLLCNGSFEIPGPIPYAWGSGHWGVGAMPWAGDMDLWRAHWGLDHTRAYAGKTSLRIINGPGLPELRAISAWFNLRSDKGVTYTLSAELQADRDNLPVGMSCDGRSIVAKAGKKWTRAVLTGLKGGERLAVIIAPQAEGTLWIDAVQVQPAGEDTVEFHPYLEDADLAAREAKVDWSPPRRTAQIAAGRVTTGPVQAARVTIDDHGRFLVNGQPYLQCSLGLEFVSDLKVLDAVAKAGFPDVCLQIKPNVTTARFKQLMDHCAELGLRVIPWLDGRIPLDLFKAHITALRNSPALLCWYVYDEPSGARFAQANERLKLAHQLDPAHPAFINYLSSKLTGQMGDLYSTDVYPIPHGTPMAAINAVATMAADAAPQHKPVWIWLQGTGYAYWMAREPTPRELSCMVYGSLIKGARGIYYFAQIPRTKQCFDEMRALNVELARLAPVLGSLDPAPAVTCQTPGVLCQAYRYQGETWVLAVNTRNQPCSAQFKVPAGTHGAEVVFEGRQVKATGGSLKDDFGVYERHVYRLN